MGITISLDETFKDTVITPISYIARFAQWFYFTLIPYVLQYIGIPMFALGILLAVAFAGGTVLFTIVFFIAMFYFLRGTIFSSKPIVK